MNRAEQRLPVVDGLRALAVVAVVLFHGFPGIVGGGYVGVDIFFVISGFVIALRYMEPLVAGEVRFSTFFLRRIRRLVPAYFAMLVVTTAIAAALMVPRDLINFGYSLIGQALYAQNVVFWVQGEYFDSALLKPLLHTWSLAIEEQFYLGFPLLILALRWRPGLTAAACVLLAIAMIGAGAVVEQVSAKTSFYWLPFRIWEFLAGIAAAMLFRRGVADRLSTGVATGIGCVALASMLLAVLAFDDESARIVTQGFLAVFAAAALCLVQARLSPAFSVLFTNRVAQHLGRISYSWYLWHWPPIAFLFLLLGRPATMAEAAALTVLGYALGYLSWRLFEQAASRAAWLAPPSRTVTLLLAFLCFAAVAGAAMVMSHGLVQRYPKQARPLLLAQMDRPDGRCSFLARLRGLRSQTCPITHASGPGGILVIGDSHAEMQKHVLASLGDEHDVPVYLAQQNCRIIDFGVDRNCKARVWRGLAKDIKRLGVTRILVIALWDDRLDRPGFDAAIERLLTTGTQIVIQRPTPHDPALAPAVYLDRPGDWWDVSRYSRAAHEAREHDVNRAISEWAARDPRITVIDPVPLLCPGENCLFALGNGPLYSDTHHLTTLGAEAIAPIYGPLFAAAARDRAAGPGKP